MKPWVEQGGEYFNDGSSYVVNFSTAFDYDILVVAGCYTSVNDSIYANEYPHDWDKTRFIYSQTSRRRYRWFANGFGNPG